MDVASVPGLPEGAVELFREEGIEQLYPPQAEAVEAGVTEGENLVASVPTASGKTLIAQLAMCSAIGGHAGASGGSSASAGGTALYIVPLRALASEKAAEFEALERLGIDVGISTGNYDASGEWLAGKDLIVATSEKVDSLVRNGASWIEDVGCVVADEVHLIDDPDRGPTLEVTLAKLRALNPDAQVVALSATIDNAGAIAQWLDAELVDTDWRPIELRMGVHYGDAVHFDDGEQAELPVGASEKPTAAIVRDTLAEDGSTLVFVNSRRNAESAAGRLADAVDPHLTDDERTDLAALAEELRAVGDTETSDDLAQAVERGAAFHHAGLQSEHRSLIEDAFRDRLVKVVTATPTLAAGVNTPSRRVVVRDWRRYDGTAGGMQPLPVLEVHQMMGRAGRPGRDPYGEALLLATTHDELDELFERYVEADPEPVDSKLAAEPALRTHVLATIASGFARSRGDLLDFFDRTFYASQTTDPGRIETVVDSVLTYLQRNGFVEHTVGTSSDEPSLAGAREADGDALSATSLGHTVSRLYLDPMSAAEIVDGIEDAVDRARGDGRGADATGRTRTPADAAASDDGSDDATAGFTQASALFDDEDATGQAGDPGATDPDDPPEPDEAAAGDPPEAVGLSALGLYHLVCRTPDMYELYLRSGDKEQYAELYYEREREFLGPAPSEYEESRFEDWLASLKTAKLLEDWADEVDEATITDRYGVGPGDIRSKVDTAEWLLGATESIVSDLEFPVGNSVREARMRVAHGVREDLLELVGVRNVGRKRARRLYEAGIETREALRTADKGVVLAALRGRRKTAETVLENAGREDASMTAVEPVDPDEIDGEVPVASGGGSAGTGENRNASGGEPPADDDQSSLGDFS